VRGRTGRDSKTKNENRDARDSVASRATGIGLVVNDGEETSIIHVGRKMYRNSVSQTAGAAESIFGGSREKVFFNRILGNLCFLNFFIL